MFPRQWGMQRLSRSLLPPRAVTSTQGLPTSPTTRTEQNWSCKPDSSQFQKCDGTSFISCSSSRSSHCWNHFPTTSGFSPDALAAERAFGFCLKKKKKKKLKPVIPSSAFYFREAFDIIGLCIIKCNSLDISFGKGETSFGEKLDKTGQFFLRFLWQVLLPPKCIARASNFAANSP